MSPTRRSSTHSRVKWMKRRAPGASDVSRFSLVLLPELRQLPLMRSRAGAAAVDPCEGFSRSTLTSESFPLVCLLVFLLPRRPSHRKSKRTCGRDRKRSSVGLNVEESVHEQQQNNSRKQNKTRASSSRTPAEQIAINNASRPPASNGLMLCNLQNTHCMGIFKREDMRTLTLHQENMNR